MELVGDKGLLKDINAGAGSSTPRLFAELLGKAYFTASSGGTSATTNLWVTDGTSFGTTSVLPSVPSGTVFHELVAAKTFLTFIADDGTGAHLWRMVPGTNMQKLVISGAVEITNLTAVEDHVFFNVYIQGQGSRLYAVAATGNPTQVASFGANKLRAARGKLYFSGFSTGGAELWEADPATLTASQMADINPGVASSHPDEMVELNGDLYFTADDGTHGTELWVAPANGSAPTLFKDLVPGAGSPFSGYRGHLTAAGGRLFFLAYEQSTGYEPCYTDGNPLNVTCFDLAAGPNSSMPLASPGMVAAGDAIYLLPFNASTGPGVRRMGPQDSAPGVLPGPVPVSPSMLTAAGNVVFFRDGYSNSGEIWRADIRQVTDLGAFGVTPDQNDPLPLGYLSSRGYLLLSATGGSVGQEVHYVDSRMPTPLINNGDKYQVNGKIKVGYGTAYFAGTGPSGDVELIKARNGTMAEIDLNHLGSSNPDGFVELNGDVYFAATRAGGYRELWVDGLTKGTVVVKYINPFGGSDPKDLVVLGTNIYFTADDGTARKLFRSDGTSAGTVAINVPNGSNIGRLTATSNRLYFAATDNTTFEEDLWVYTPGAAAAIKLSVPANNGVGTWPTEIVASGLFVYFIGYDDSSAFDFRLFRTSGSTPVLLTGQLGTPSNLVRPEGSSLVLFSANNSLWKANGPAAVLVNASSTSSTCTSPGSYVTGATATDVYFACSNSTSDRELWRTDGANYWSYTQFHPTGSGNVEPLLLVSNRLYVSADDGIAGQELHLVDTSSATVRSHFDLVPGPSSSSPGQLKAVNGGWVMTVSDGAGPATLYFSDNL